MARNIKIHLLRKEYYTESGNDSPSTYELQLSKKKGVYYIEPCDERLVNKMIISNGVMQIPDLDYIDWLEEEIIKLKDLCQEKL